MFAMRSRLFTAVLSLSACGPEVAPLAELSELCGQEAPVKLLELEEHQYFWSTETARAGNERIVLTVHDYDPSGDGWFHTGGTLWSVGSCGEEPRVLATGATLLPWPEHVLGDAGGLVLACMVGSGDIVVLDPTGREEATTLFEGTQCDPRWTEHGAIELRQHGEANTLVLYPLPDDLRAGAFEPRMLVESVRLGFLQWAVRADEVFVVTSDDALLRVGLPQGGATVEQTGVRVFSATNEWIVWQEISPGFYDNVFLRDRATGEDRFLGETNLILDPNGPFPGGPFVDEHDVLVIGFGPGSGSFQRVFFLPTLDHVDLPEGEVLRWHVEGDQWVTQKAGGQSFIRSLRSEQRVSFFDRRAQIFSAEGGAHAYGGALCCGFSTFQETGPMWFVPYEGSSRKLAERVSMFHVRAADHRITTVLDLDDEHRGNLFAIAPERLVEQLVDRRVFAPSVRLFDDDSILYGVLDGDRSGIWRTRVAPN